jgi:hypothetical protein
MIIGLTGLAGAGKSTVANYLVEKHGFERVSFAGPLKKMLRTLNPILSVTDNEGGDEYGLTRAGEIFDLGWTENAVKEDPEMGPEYRRLLQVLGTDCIRSIDEEFWVKAARASLVPGLKYVFDDVRFPNEAATIKPWSLWNVIRPGRQAVIGGHISEQHAGRMGERIQLLNDSTPENLFAAVDGALEYVHGRAAVAEKEFAL